MHSLHHRFSLASLLVLSSTPFAQRNVQLSAPLERAPVGSVESMRVSRDGKRLTYVADPLQDDAFRLYRASVDGTEPVHDLGPALPFAVDHDLDATGARVFRRAPDPLTGRIELFSQAGDGSGEPVKLNGTLVTGGSVLDFSLSPDGAWVLYRSDQELDQRIELFAVPSGGGTAVKVNGPLPAGGRVESGYVLGPDGRSVFFRALVGTNAIELFRGRLSGRQPVERLCAPHATNRAVASFAVTPDGSRVAYRADSRINDHFELFVVPSDGSAEPRPIGPGLPAGSSVHEFTLTSNGKRALCLADPLRGKIELFSVPLAGGAVSQLSPSLGSNSDVFEPRLTLDGRSVVFRANPDGPFNAELFLAPVDGSEPARRLGPDLGLQARVIQFQLHAKRVVYVVDDADRLERQVFSIPLDEHAEAVALSEAFERGFLPFLLVGPTRVVFSTPRGFSSAPLDGSAAPIDLGIPAAFASLAAEIVESDESGEILLAPRRDGLAMNLVALAADGRTPPLRVNAPFPEIQLVENVHQAAVDARGDVAAYVTSGDVLGHLVRVDPQLRSAPFELGRVDHAAGVRFSADGTRLVSKLDEALFAVPVDGSGPPQTLVRDIQWFLVSPVGDFALVLTYGDGGSELHRVPLDGSASTLLSTLPAGRAVSISPQPEIGSDGRWVVFHATDPGGSVNELFRVPSDGSAIPERVSSAGGGVSRLRLSPDGGSVAFLESGSLFVSRLASGETRFVRSLDGSALFLTFEFDASGRRLVVLDERDLFVHETGLAVRHVNASQPDEVLHFALDPSGRRLTYLTFLDGNTAQVVYDVWSATLDATSAPQRLNDRPAGPARMSNQALGPVALALSPDGRTAAFTEQDRLVAAPLDGSGAPVVLVLDAERFRFGASLSITPDSGTLVYASDGIFALPLSGLRAPRRLDTAVPRQGLRSPQDLQLLPDGSGVLYIAEQDTDGAFELYLGFLEQLVRGDTAPRASLR